MPTIIKNGRNYSGTSVSLTQAEYDVLPEITKMNGTTYFITDSEVVLNAKDVALDEGNLNDLAGSVATIETSPATANHEVGEYILWNGVLYTVTSAIATGENLVVNSNISVRTIGTELQTLNNGLMLESNTALVSSISARVAVAVVKIENVPKGHYIVSASVRFSEASGTSGIIYARINGNNTMVASLYATDQYADYTTVLNVTSDNATVDIMVYVTTARTLLETEMKLLKV